MRADLILGDNFLEENLDIIIKKMCAWRIVNGNIDAHIYFLPHNLYYSKNSEIYKKPFPAT